MNPIGPCLLLTIFLAAPGALAQGLTAHGPYGGDVRSLAVHPTEPDRFFLGTSDSQIFVSTTAGRSWTQVSPGLGRRGLVIDNIAFHPTDPSRLYVATWELRSNRGAVYRSEDGGSSWGKFDTGEFDSAVRAIAISPSNPDHLALGLSEGVLLSRDGGENWDRITRGYRSLHNVESLAFDPLNPQTLYVGTWHLGWKTENAGQNWQPIHKGMISDSDMFSLLVNPQNPEVLFASACTGVYRSDNAGAQWEKLRNGLPREAKRVRTLQLDPSDSETIYAGTTVGLFVSGDGGASWRKLLSDLVINAIAVHPRNPQHLIIGTDDAGILLSSDGGKNFQTSNSGFVHRQVSVLADNGSNDDPRYFASVVSDGNHGGFYWSPEGSEWSPHNDGLGSAVSGIKDIITSESSVFIGTGQGVFSGSPPEGNWRVLGGTEKLAVFDLSFADRVRSALLVASEQGLFKVSIPGGGAKKIALPSVHSGTVTSVLLSESGHLFVGTDTGIFKSSDHGSTWKIAVHGLPVVRINTLLSSGSRLLSGTRKGLFLSKDDGETWESLAENWPLDIISIESVPGRPELILAADSIFGNILLSRDSGDHWEKLELGRLEGGVSQLLATPNKLLVGTLSDGIYNLQVEALLERP